MRLQIGPFNVAVTTDPRMVDLGEWDGRNLLVKIRSDQAAGQQRDTLLHEILHAVVTVVGQECHEGIEDVVAALSPTLLDTLRRNPDLVKYLTGEYDGIESFESTACGSETVSAVPSRWVAAPRGRDSVPGVGSGRIAAIVPRDRGAGDSGLPKSNAGTC